MLLGALLLTSCGYRFVGGQPPFGASRVAVTVFEETEPVGIASELTQALARFIAGTGASLTSDTTTADAVLSGEVVSAATYVSPFGAALDANNGISGFRVDLRVRAVLRAPGGQIFWDSQVVQVSEDFVPALSTGDNAPLVTEANRRRALRRAVETAARRLHESLTLAAATEPTDAPAQ